MMHVCCVQVGNYLGRGAEYVNVLYDQILRNLAAGTEGEFVCFTDDTSLPYAPGMVVRELPPGLQGWWAKLWLFSPDLFPKGDRVLYFDLDTIVIGPIDDVAKYDGDFATLRDFFRHDGLQSAVMAWRAGTCDDIWMRWMHEFCPKPEGGDQAWIEQCRPQADVLQSLYPRRFVSYKAACNPYPPRGSSVVCFHGLPRPHEVTTGWVPQAWKVGGIGSVEIEVICNTELDAIKANCRYAMTLGFPEVKEVEPHNRPLCIVGGAPSVRGHFDILRLRASSGQTVWALNGAARMLQRAGVRVDGQWIVDARPGNSKFLVPGPRQYVASQCARDVLDRATRPVLFHDLNCGPFLPEGVTLIGGGTTVGMKALAAAYVLGYRTIHLYGMDSSLDGDAHHAYEQPENDADARINVHLGDATFVSTPWMVRQVEDFQGLAAALANDECEVHVHCGGLLGHVAKMMMEPTVTAADMRAAAILEHLGEVERPVGAEIGVFAGDTSCRLLAAHPGLTLHMVDSWEGDGAAYSGDSGDWHATLSRDQQASYMRRAKAAVKFAKDRARIMQARSADAAAHIADRSLDFVFIDADHSYDGCMADIKAWAPKLKPGGLMSGHDYENTAFPKFGVAAAVNEWAASIGATVETGDNFTWFIRLPVAGAMEAA